MPVSLNNNKDIVVTSVSILTSNDMLNVADEFTTTSNILDSKADRNTTYTREVTNQLLDAKVDDTEMVNYAIKSDTYTKSEINDKFTNIISGAPDALNSLKELSDALGADANFSTTMLNQLNEKAPKASPTLTGTINMNTIDTIPNASIYPDLNVLQNLKVGTGLAPKNLTVLGNSTVVGSLGVIGATNLGDDLNVGSLDLQQSGITNDLHVFGDASVTGALTVAGTDVTATLSTKAPSASPIFTGIISTNNIDTVPDVDNIKPDLFVLQNLRVGTGLAPKNLTVLGNSTVAGSLGVLGVSTLDNVNVGTLLLHQSGTNKNLNVYGDTSVIGALTVAGTDVISTLNTKAPNLAQHSPVPLQV